MARPRNDYSGRNGRKKQALAFVLTVAMVLISYLVASAAQQSGSPVAAAVVITIADALLPYLVKEACSLERHHNSVSEDLSFMNKVCVHRTKKLK